MKRNCCTCLARIEDEENAPILTMGAYGNPKCLCPDCASLVDEITLGRDYASITAAMDALTAKMSKANVDDSITVSTMTTLLSESAERAQKIKEGNYDFSLDDSESEDEGYDEIPDELKETEEDRLLDEKEAESNKKFDKLLNWMWAGVAVVAIGIIAYRLISALL